jgi:two-component system sensor histidine kinase MprB
MSLRRRIAGAAALSVAAVAIAIGAVGYASTRSHLIGELRQELAGRAQPFLAPDPAGGPRGSDSPTPPPGPRFGGAPGYFQFTGADGTTRTPDGKAPQLPVTARTVAIARRASGSFYSTARVGGVHLEVLTVGDPYDHTAVQVALPLSGVDSVLHGLLLTYGLLVGGGILLALLLGVAISRSALSPIERFLRRSEDVTRELHRPQRIEETGATELRRLATSFNSTLDALERSIESQRHLIADASHELRTPIAALRSNIQIFLQSDRLPEAEREGLQAAILAELDELTQVVSDVLELARGAASTGRSEPGEGVPRGREGGAHAQRRDPSLQVELDLTPTVVVGDPDRIARAISNVVDNARKWSPPGGQIAVALRGATVSVRDHGAGFEEEDLPHVFDRFYRAQSARRMPGSGLGLAIVQQAALAHGGFARAANVPGGGALVEVGFGALI